MKHRFENHDLIGDRASQPIEVTDGARAAVERQRIFFCELDRSGPRKVFIQVIGE